jgi:teichuronic acid exporter
MSLKQQTLTGLTWSVVDNFSNLGIQFVVGVILARLLSPREFGLVGMIAVFISVSLLFIDGGFSQSLIRKKECTQADYSTVFFFNLLASLALYALLFALARPISRFFNEPKLADIIRVVGMGLIIGSLSIIQRTILVKKIDFKLQTKISVVSSLVSGAVAIYLALAGFGVWSLVWRTITANLLTTALLWGWNRWHPVMSFDRQAFKEHFRFGYKLLLSNLINTVYQNAYYLLIGKYFSAVQLGYYVKAEEFSNLPSSNITNVIQRVSYPVLSQLQDDPQKLKNGFKKIIKSTMYISFVLMMGLAAAAKPLVITLIGQKWDTSVVYLQLLCFSAMLYPLHALNLNVLNVKGRSDLALKIEIIKKSLIIPIVLGTMLLGIKAMLAGMILISVAAFFLNAHYSGRLINYGIKEQVNDILPSFLIGAAVGGVVFLEASLIRSSFPVILTVQVLSGAFLTILISESFKYGPYLEMKSLITDKLKKR